MADPVPNTMVDGRYRVVSRLGSGGMADVFLAEDQQLGRKVALKLLHHRFAQDPDFVERFRREAQAAAGLQHPNVVSVYDRGSFDDTYYIAMEYLPGRSLKQLIREEAPLDPLRAIDITIQILKAARFAHRRGVIHRDLKPHNVIVDDSGHAKVTDFGIARAGASDMTETGSIMGTAQYLSPEQAQGHAVNAGSDLYSVGVVLYEMLTGRVPFEADSAVSIALKHVSEAPPPPSSINPNIPPELEQTVLWVLNKNASDRPADADQLITVLEHCREAIASAGAGQHTASMAAVAAAGAAAGAGAAIVGPGLAAYQQAQSQATNGSGELSAVRPPEDHEGRGWALWGWLLLVILLIAGAAAAAYFLTRPKQVLVPKVIGEQISTARATVQQAKFQVSTVSVVNRKPSGIVVSESPSAGSKADKGSTVTLSVSSGPGDVSIPPVQGLSQAAATRALRRAGLKVGNVVPRPSNQFSAGQATATNPGVARNVPRGFTVTLFVSSGAPQKQVPSVVGESQTQAAADLTRAGFTVHTRNQASASVPVGNVISQSPTGNVKAPNGSGVTITVATAPPTVTVPKVIGDPAAGAVSALTAAGLKVTQTTRAVTKAGNNGVVVDQSPAGNSTAKKGSLVTIVVGVLSSSSTTTSSTTTTTTSTSPTTSTTSTTTTHGQ
ncbi:MAG TPA: Stk1 family PASTA domain-containing Ser/Thr kinase [Solirubrobacteraceae bacterium]|jgi:serine/threonine-protein kinase|nr:Stk1 family PASTA domain-containing Ser/Thr kinase [Solirubrobacteraceae bacterium]